MKPKNIINSVIILAVFTLVFFANTNFVFSAPAPWGIAINSQNKTCTNYWAGDEFSSNPLPSGWESYYPKLAYNSIDTSLGSCKFSSFSDFYAREITDNWKSCFNSISCNYVDFNNFNKSYLDLLNKDYSCVKLSNDKFWSTSLAVDTNNKQCTLMTCAQSVGTVAEPYKKYSNGLEVYSRPQEYVSFKTKVGTCTIKQNTGNDFSDCCNQLGYAFVQSVNDTTGNVKNNIPVNNLDNNLPKKTNGNYYLVTVGVLSLFTVALISGLVIFKKHKSKKNLPPSSTEPSNPPKAD